MIGQKVIFLGATLVASGVYGVAYKYASDIYLLRANASKEFIEKTFQVDLLPMVPVDTFRRDGESDSPD